MGIEYLKKYIIVCDGVSCINIFNDNNYDSASLQCAAERSFWLKDGDIWTCPGCQAKAKAKAKEAKNRQSQNDPVDAMAYAMCCENKLLRLSPDKIEEIRSLIKKMGEKLKPKTPKPDFVEPVIEKRTCGNCGFLRDRVGGINTFKCFCKAENTNIHFKGCGLWKPKERTCETCVLFLGKHPIVANFYHCVEVPLFASLCPCEEWTPKPLVLERRNVPTRCGNCGFRLGPRSARVVVEKLPKEENVVVAGDSDSGYVIIGSPKMFNEDLFFIDRRVFSHNYLCAAALDSGVMEVE